MKIEYNEKYLSITMAKPSTDFYNRVSILILILGFAAFPILSNAQMRSVSIHGGIGHYESLSVGTSFHSGKKYSLSVSAGTNFSTFSNKYNCLAVSNNWDVKKIEAFNTILGTGFSIFKWHNEDTLYIVDAVGGAFFISLTKPLGNNFVISVYAGPTYSYPYLIERQSNDDIGWIRELNANISVRIAYYIWKEKMNTKAQE